MAVGYRNVKIRIPWMEQKLLESKNDDLAKSLKTVTPAEAGVQISLNLLDSRFRGNDKNGEIATFCETIKNRIFQFETIDGAAISLGTLRAVMRESGPVFTRISGTGSRIMLVEGLKRMGGR